MLIRHRSTQAENPGGGGSSDFCQNLGGGGAVNAFRTKLPGGSPTLGFIAFLLTFFWKCAWGGPVLYHPPFPPLPSRCTYVMRICFEFNSILFSATNVIIAIAVGSSLTVVIVCAAFIVWWFCVHKKRKQQNRNQTKTAESPDQVCIIQRRCQLHNYHQTVTKY